MDALDDPDALDPDPDGSSGLLGGDEPDAAAAQPMDANAAARAMEAFDRLMASNPAFCQRPGQRAMAQRIADSLHDATPGNARRAIAVIQAGTGVGKSAAYLATAVGLALSCNTRVVVSTATVALQEQLLHKDLPALAAALDVPLTFALAKGRGRYVCKLQLERYADAEGGSLLDWAEDGTPQSEGEPRSRSQTAQFERRMRLYRSLAQALAEGEWAGDRDTLSQPMDPADWAPIAAERHTCTARHCPRYRDCCYYSAKLALVQAQVIVANHDLILASLGMRALPDPDKCILVFDEGHHLPSVALERFASAMDVTNLRWLDRLPGVLHSAAREMEHTPSIDVSATALQLRRAMQDIARALQGLVPIATTADSATHRFPNGVWPQELVEPMALTQEHACTLLHELTELGAALKRQARDNPTQSADCAARYANLGQMASRLSGVAQAASMLLAPEERSVAKWVEASAPSGIVTLRIHAGPLFAGGLLQERLWNVAQAVVITSATLTTCNSFDYFLRETGLQGLPQVSALAVDSPFDYARQGELVVVATAADPRNVEAYTQEVVQALLADLREVERGALALFTSRTQMQAAVNALDEALRERVLVQGDMARPRLLERHAERIAAGQPSILFGLQSFGEGLDLPGPLCEVLYIAKLPFAPPTDPVQEARAEWLRSRGGDPFHELVVPETGIRLLQWTGRAIRTETDRARLVCYDKRLTHTAYGRRILAGLPPYAKVQRNC
ncbi:ATP-dependent DNA helicase DinG [Candidatus Symbiobacter mobilis]|nr:ATP-dependent DNA helicase DinG [Candidatus Symbiobacter mobilis]